MKKEWYNNGIKEICIYNTNIPEGFVKGRLKTGRKAWNSGMKMSYEYRSKLRAAHKECIWISNGVIEKLWNKDDNIPDGFNKGRLPVKEEVKQKISAAKKGEKNPNYGHTWNSEQKARAKQRAIDNPIRWTDEQKAMQSERLKGKNTWSKGRNRSEESVKKWLYAMSQKTEEDKKRWKQKEYETKKRNNSFNSSRIEEKFYKDLCIKYGTNNVIRQYRDTRYPFSCDFYIPSHDLFIELNAHWTHGGRPFDKDDSNCIEQLNIWESKAAEGLKFYKSAIYTWTNLDCRKMNIAKENNLNYEVIYNAE